MADGVRRERGLAFRPCHIPQNHSDLPAWLPWKARRWTPAACNRFCAFSGAVANSGNTAGLLWNKGDRGTLRCSEVPSAYATYGKTITSTHRSLSWTSPPLSSSSLSSFSWAAAFMAVGAGIEPHRSLCPAGASEPGSPASNTKLTVCTVINSRRTRLSSFIDSSFNQHQNMPVTIDRQAYRAAGVGQ